jgi:thiamine pyrophosphate-dependent acetolactate synthase large subunit-like protein
MTISNCIIERLIAWGVDTVFGQSSTATNGCKRRRTERKEVRSGNAPKVRG